MDLESSPRDTTVPQEVRSEIEAVIERWIDLLKAGTLQEYVDQSASPTAIKLAARYPDTRDQQLERLKSRLDDVLAQFEAFQSGERLCPRCLLGMGRILAPLDGWGEAGSEVEEMAARINAAVGMFLVLLAPPVAFCWLTLTAFRISLGSVAGGILCWAMLTWASTYLLHMTVAGADSLGDVFEAVVCIQLGATAAACLTTVPLRLRGYRLRRAWHS